MARDLCCVVIVIIIIIIVIIIIIIIKLKLVIRDLFLLFSLSACIISEGANNIL